MRLSKPIIIALLLVSSIGCTSRIRQITAQKDAQWCNPEALGGLNNGYQQFYCKPNDNGPEGRKGQWEEDVEAEKQVAVHEAHLYALASALTTRVLTIKEMNEVLQLGSRIFIHSMQPYRQEEIDERYIMALKIQAQLREMK